MKRLDPDRLLEPLKDFQRRTVDYVIRRLYEDPDHGRHFLVADEVGLGKTLVARGVVARMIHELWPTVARIDVVYVCSNTAIAQQNINRLNVIGAAATPLPTRLTLLPLHLAGPRSLRRNKVNFVSLTPGTAFDLRSSMGIVKERALIYNLLTGSIEPDPGLANLLRGWIEDPSTWRWWREDVAGAEVDRDLKGDFQKAVLDCQPLIQKLEELSQQFCEHGHPGQHPPPIRRRQSEVVAELRKKLAQVCVKALEPDLVILDEFQRFPTLLDGDDDAAKLARQLLECVDRDGNEARTLLLSATPYRALSLSSDSDDSGVHYRELLRTVEFLYGSDRGREVVSVLGRELRQFRREMFSASDGNQRPRELKSSIEGTLRKVIARTERVAVERNSMTTEPDIPASVEVADLLQAVSVHRLAQAVRLGSIVEYWKSGPYLLNFMRGSSSGAAQGYQLKRALKSEPHISDVKILQLVKEARKHCLNLDEIDAYRPLEPANARMRALTEGMLDEFRLDQHLWIPPSLPYYGDRKKLNHRPSKALVFSSWAFVPDVIAAVLSYEAERRMYRQGEPGRSYFDSKALGALRFRNATGRPEALRDLNLIYPSPEIARVADPLAVIASHAALLPYERMRAELKKRLRPLVNRLSEAQDPSPGPETWQWAAAAVLDVLSDADCPDWLLVSKALNDLTHEKAFSSHLDALRKAAEGRHVRGLHRDRCLNLMVDLALGSPAICALRALRRVAPSLKWSNPVLLRGAARIAFGFRTLYSQRETVAMLRKGRRDAYWHAAISFGARNNLQAMLDEYAHFAVEALGLMDKDPVERIKELAAVICDAVSLRPSVVDVEDPLVRDGKLEFRRRKMRGRFAMRFARFREEGGSVKRAGSIQTAFNSPFRPFVLATTSIGQEGLDFHPYCRFLYHWNLPHNPVDLEQREGRVHRYKCHAVRLNVADKHADAVRGSGTAPSDPWMEMFKAASKKASENSADHGGLVPFWMYDGDHHVERRVPRLPYSKEESRLRWLKESLAVYRLAFGQPRQDDFLQFLQQMGKSASPEDLAELQISLEPPKDDCRPDAEADRS